MGVVDEEQAAARGDLSAAVHGFALAENALRDAVARARAAKIPVAEIARTLGVTRTTIYNWTKPK